MIAELEYQANGFKMIEYGTHVICAVSNQIILLSKLKYWSVIRQEAYASPVESLIAYQKYGNI